jgi:uncharacterized membrane protein
MCFLHARKKGDAALAYLLGGFVFGLALEYLEVLESSYTYGRFYLMLGRSPVDIPLCIGCAWGIIIYTARLFSDGLGLPLMGAAACDTLLALNIDLSLDVVAYRMHMWHWDWTGSRLNPLTAQWFGIPYGNFIGWTTVVFSYSYFARLFERKLASGNKPGALRFGGVAALATICSLIVLFGTELTLFPFLRYLGLSSGPRLLIITAMLLVATILGWKKRQAFTQPIPPLAQWVPLWFHIFFVFCFFALGFYRENKWMTAVTCLNALIGMAIHLYPAKVCAAEPHLARSSRELEYAGEV